MQVTSIFELLRNLNIETKKTIISMFGILFCREMIHHVCVSSFYQFCATILHLGILVCR